MRFNKKLLSVAVVLYSLQMFSQSISDQFRATNSYTVEIDSVQISGLSNYEKSQLVSRVGPKLYTVYKKFDKTGVKFHPIYTNKNGDFKFYVNSSIIVRFNPSFNVNIKDFCQDYDLTIADSSFNEIATVFNSNDEPLTLCDSLMKLPFVSYCTPDLYTDALRKTSVNDEYYNKQWYLNNTGQQTNDGKYGTVDADIDAPEALLITKGSPSVTISVIDEGIEANHVDLPSSCQLRLNGSNFGNGSNKNNPSPDVDSLEAKSHGQNCAGIIAAQHNSIGIAGIAPDCQIMPVKVSFPDCNGFGGSSISSFVKAIKFAVDNGADVVSNSWGYYTNNPTSYLLPIGSAVKYAVDKGVVMVFSAGNSANRQNSDYGYVIYPAYLSYDGIITVGASDRNDLVANYSPRGQSLDVCAPSNSAMPSNVSGESLNIWTTDLTGVFGLNPFKSCSALTLPFQNEILPSTGSNNKAFTGRFGGTSASAPQVAGIIALMKSVNPCLGIADIQHLLRYSTDRIGNGNYFGNSFYPGLSEDYGYGRVNAHKAVLAAQAFSSTDLDLYMRDKSKDFGNNSGYTWSWDFDNSPDIWVRNQQDDILVSEQIEYTQGGTTYVYVRVGNKSCVSSKGTENVSRQRKLD